VVLATATGTAAVVLAGASAASAAQSSVGLDTGRPLTDQEVVGEVAGNPDRVHYWLADFYPVKVHGAKMVIYVVAIDITARKLQLLERARFALTHASAGTLVG
jgi:hypothetical protein